VQGRFFVCEELEKTCLLRKGQQWMPPEKYRPDGGM